MIVHTLARAATSSTSHHDFEFLPACGKLRMEKKEEKKTEMELRFISTN
jgi:hypothetical protein